MLLVHYLYENQSWASSYCYIATDHQDALQRLETTLYQTVPKFWDEWWHELIRNLMEDKSDDNIEEAIIDEYELEYSKYYMNLSDTWVTERYKANIVEIKEGKRNVSELF